MLQPKDATRSCGGDAGMFPHCLRRRSPF